MTYYVHTLVEKDGDLMIEDTATVSAIMQDAKFDVPYPAGRNRYGQAKYIMFEEA